MREMHAKNIKIILILLGVVPLLGIIGYFSFKTIKKPIKIGILHSLTGSQALSEKPLVDAELMAIDEINAAGGLLKQPVLAVIADGKSDEKVFAQEAERLINQEKVSAIIGCWTSASRKAVKAVVEKYNNLLIYPVSYEGLEDSPNIFYVGANQNQQIVPSVVWSYYNLGKKFFLVGSDYIFSRAANAIARATLLAMQGIIVGEEYILLGSNDVSSMIAKIKEAQPDVILNTIQGESNLAFFKQLRAEGLTPEKLPIMSVSSVSETEFAQIGASAMAGDYVTATYFQSIEREQNVLFISNFKKRYGADRVISEAIESAYVGIHIWGHTVEIAQKSEPSKVIRYIQNRILNAPSGIIYSDNKMNDMWRMVFVGKLRSDGQFSIIWNSDKQIQPVNYPIFMEKKKWDEFISNLYQQWGGSWSRRQ
ncbi:MAG: urea ABC transporter substrate-binding protein [Candidatus Babeliales bacterium]